MDAAWRAWTGRFAAAAFVLAACVSVTMADGDLLPPTSTDTFGTFNGVLYKKYVGRLQGMTSTGDYRVPYEIIAPAEPALGNRRLLVEPPHVRGGPGARDGWLGRAFLFGRGFSHAQVGWSTRLRSGQKTRSIIEPLATDVFIKGGFAQAGGRTDDEIVADFANALKGKDLDAFGLVGNIKAIYNIGFSQSSGAVKRILVSPFGQGLFDLSFPMTTGSSNSPKEVEGAGRIIVFLAEADVKPSNAAALRDDGTNPSYRSYEVAGAPHIPDTEGTRLHFPGPPDSAGPPIAGTSPIDWRPFIRALFVAGDRWVTEGVEPPPSIFLEEDPSQPDGIARDCDGNAKGGIRAPDLAIGRRQFIAVDSSSFRAFGDFVDLECEPRRSPVTCEPIGDGQPRFQSHESYVERVTAETHKLIAERFLLPEDGALIIQEANASQVGVGPCP